MITSWARLVTSFVFVSVMHESEAFTGEYPVLRQLEAYIDTPCSPRGGQPHDCVKVSECPIFSQLIQRQPQSEVKETLKKLHCGYHDKIPKICCLRREHKNLHLLKQNACGQYDESKTNGGQVADLNEFPWMVLISYKFYNRRKFMCGGSLINDKYVLTAAHCISPFLYGVRIGEYNIHQKRDCITYVREEECADQVQDLQIERTIIHEQFERESLSNDIALIRLQRSVDLTKANAKPICLPTTFDKRALNLTNLSMTVAGWGVSGDANSSDVLQKVKVPVVSNKNCKTIRSYLTPEKLCAGYLGIDSCKGDSGGPLISLQLEEKNLVYMQFGIGSYGISNNCGDAYHGVYTRVSVFMNWILDNLEP